ncbi:hypothetical protein [Fundidesulfovibrio agrisoli]|uniref:hypothetical protein n=1 Tax=Fundidesulfovibrio agrisoli TaxID=2922717 RepID=UPI001FAE2FF6|nr:hypothetical protein [Fundidesulfovibrio agrisoli]
MPARPTLAALCLLTLLLCAAPAAAANLTLTLDADWDLEFTLSDMGGNSKVAAVGTGTQTYGGTTLQTALFQSQGTVGLTVKAIYKGSAPGTVNLTVDPQRIGLNFSKVGTDAVNAKYTSESFYAADQKDSGYSNYWPLTIYAELQPPGGLPTVYFSGVVELDVAQFRHTWVSGGWSGPGFLGAYDLQFTPNGQGGYALTRLPVSGESFDLVVTEPFEVTPSSPTTSTYYDWGKADFMITCPLSEFVGPKRTGRIGFAIGDEPMMSGPIELAFGYILGASDMGVERKDMLSGAWSPVQANMRVDKGDWLRLQPVVAPWGVVLPFVSVEFADGQVREVALTDGYDPDKTGETIVIVGEDELQAKSVCWTIKFTNFAQDLAINHREYAREFIWDKLIQAGVNAVAPGSSWLLRKGASKTIGYTLEKGAEVLGYQSPPQPGAAQPLQTAGQASAAQAAGASGFTPPDALTGNNAAVVSILSNGGMTATNVTGTLRVTDAGNVSRLLPPRSQVTYNASFGPVLPMDYTPTPYEQYHQFTINPANNGYVGSLTPLITIAYSGYQSAYDSQSLTCRINGVMVPSFSSLGSTQATYQVPDLARLNYGYNTIEASIWDSLSGPESKSSTFWASGSVKAPLALMAYPGKTGMMLTWLPSSERGLEGYHVYKGSSAGTITQRITSTPVRSAVLNLLAENEPGLAAQDWFAVTTVASGLESPLSIPVRGSLGTASGPPPPDITDLAVTPDGLGVQVNFTPVEGAQAYRLDRSGAAPAFFRAPPFHDEPLSVLGGYSCTVTPLGPDMVPGSTAVSPVLTAQNFTTPAPLGLSVLPQDAKRKIWALRWDPAIPGVTGFNVYESFNGGAFAKLTGSPVTDTSMTRTLVRPGLYVWKITAVSPAGESPAGPAVPGGFAVKAGPTVVGAIKLLLQ